MGETNLINLLDEHKDFFVQKVVVGFPVAAAVRCVYAEFDDIYEYTDAAFRKYLKSADGKARLNDAKEKIRKEAKEHLLSDRPGRVSILAEICGKLLVKLREFPNNEVGGKAYMAVAQEVRSTLRDIRSEMEVFGETGAGLDLFASLFEQLGKMQSESKKLPDFITRSFNNLDDTNISA